MQNLRFISRSAFELATLWAFAFAPAFAQTNVSGVLTRSDTGGPISHAIIHASPTTPLKGNPIFRTETAWDGSFIFGNLPAATYNFCVHNLDNHLNPCEWPTKNAAVPVQISTFDPKLKLKVDPGRRVHLRINDSTSLLSKPLPSGAKPEVVVLIADQSGKVWRRVPALGASGAGHYSLLVPNEPSYGFALTSTGLTLADHAGAAVPSLAFVPFAAPLTADARALILQQSHVKPDDPAVIVTVVGIRP